MIHIPRLPWNEFFMLQAHFIATRSTCDRGPELLFDPGRHGVGCVLVRDRRVIAGGYNGSPPGQPHCDDPAEFDYCTECGTKVGLTDPIPFDHVVCPICSDNRNWKRGHGGHLMVEDHCRRTIHSEANALLQCALDGTSPEGAVLYTTASPCYDCAKLIVRARIKEVYFGEPYVSRYGMSGDVSGMLESVGIKFHQVESDLRWRMLSPNRLWEEMTKREFYEGREGVKLEKTEK